MKNNMKKRFLKIYFSKKLSILLVIFSILVTSNLSFNINKPSIIHAQSLTNPQSFCDVEAAADNWRTFLASIMSYESFIEAWGDVFERYPANTCHYQDVDKIFIQLGKIRNQIQSQITSCNNESLQKLQEKYMNTELELIYVRNFVVFEGNEVFTVTNDIVYESAYAYLKEELGETYIKSKFAEFETRYSKRIETYKKCKDQNLEALVKKFNSLIDNIKSMGTQIEKSAQGWDKTINTSPQNTGKFFQGFLQKRLSELAPKPSILSTINQLQGESTPQGQTGQTQPATTPTPSIDLSALNQGIVQGETTYSNARTYTELMAQYESLYKKNGDAISNEFEKTIKKMNTTLQDTYPHIDSLKSCTKKITDKQCQ